jgi:outer membrane beta-barrel protein
MIKNLSRTLTFLIFLLGLPLIAFADLYDVPKVNVIENKLYTLHDEGAIRLSYLPLDPYTKYFSVGLAYTHFFSEFVGWEIINAQYAFLFDAGLKKDLLANFSTGCPTASQCATVDKFPVLNGIATSNLVFTPIYTKNLLFNSSVVYSQASFVGGIGAALFTKPASSTVASSTSVQGCADVGMVLRYFLNSSSTIMFDFRDYIFFPSETKNQLGLTAAYIFNIGGKGR